MKLYHVTDKKNEKEIAEYGLRPALSEKLSNDDRLNIEAVYGFVDEESALNFAIDNCLSSFVIFIFDTEEKEYMIDTEYDGESIAVITEENIPASIFCEYESGVRI
jgi:hypothetical protein